ncbi:MULTISPECIES: excinuclease ABC subunit UvrC [Glycomyces]|uniref:UvrABC system protein C n=1 Tax=Glycomyces artemisiae TaxID=1076443 RepID=A0A2T0UKK8_9ACTN|nr:excinuclease ABC subunit UvrC [Glycomyces artemisiae]PRY58463.1 excinuclease ABC subunit C [Glycomyces artemisiae]
MAVDYRPAPGTIPTQPGVYRFRDRDRRVIYVGKAKNLRNRLNSYFADETRLHERTRRMVTTARSVEWTVVATEVEALQLEWTWIKEYDPRFNVMFKDDKSYPWLAVTVGEEFPRAQVMRGNRRKGVRYFGPFGSAWAIRQTLDLLTRVFPIRTCSDTEFKRCNRINRPNLLADIGKCSAPCVGRISAEDYRELVNGFCAFMSGETAPVRRRLLAEMQEASEALEFERAARLRDDLAALDKVLEQQVVVLAEDVDCDVMAVADDELEAAVQVFHVRKGRIRGQRGWVIDKAEPVDLAGIVERFCLQFYGEQNEVVPKEVLVPALPNDHEALAELLSERRGAKVDLRVPRRGDKRALAETVEKNALENLQRHKLKRAGDLTSRSKALEELADALDLPEAPLRIECYDVSQSQGEDVVASMVVFEDGLPRKSEYRRFVIKGERKDDLASLQETLRRRLSKLGDQPAGSPVEDGDEEPKRGFHYPPQLLVVDGGQPQVAAADQVFQELGIDTINLAGLAKRLEEIWLPGEEFPVILSRTSEALYLMQRVRDEAHRFAISLHRTRRRKKMTASALDSVPGLGESKKKALLKQFGSVKRIREAELSDLEAVPGIGPKLAEALQTHLRNPDDNGS